MGGSIGKKIVFFSAVYLTIVLILNASLVSCISTNNSAINNNDNNLVIMNDNPPLGDEYLIFPEYEIGILGWNTIQGHNKNEVKFFDEKGNGATNWATFSGNDYRAIEVCDVDVDGFADVLLLQKSSTTIKLWSPHTGTSKNLVVSGEYARDIACGDFDGDLDMEIAVLMCNWFGEGKTLTIIDYNGQTLKSGLELSDIDLSISWKNITAGDVDGDLIDEVIALSVEPYSDGSKICIRDEILLDDGDPINDPNCDIFSAGKTCIGLACGYFYGFNPDPNEQMTESILLSSSDSVKIINHITGDLTGWCKFPNNIGGFISTGDFDIDGDSEIVVANKVGEVQIWDAADETPFPGVHFQIDNFYWIVGISCGNWDGNGINVSYVETKNLETEYYPVALLYKPSCKDGLNYGDHTQTYSKYGWGNVEKEKNINRISVESYSQISFGGSILSNIFNLNVRLELDKYITKDIGIETAISYDTTFSTGEEKEPYVVVEKTLYNLYIYKFINGPNKNEKFVLSIPYEIDYDNCPVSDYNNNVKEAPEIIDEHEFGHPETYISKNTRGFYDEGLQTDIDPAPRGPKTDAVTISETRSKEFIESSQVSYNTNLRIFLDSIGYRSTTSLRKTKSHKIIVGTSTKFEYGIAGLDDEYQSEWGYRFQMYIRRDPQYNYVIIDFYVDPDSLGTGYGDDNITFPTVNIKLPRKGYLYIYGREIIRGIPESSNCDSFAFGEENYLVVEANDEQTGVESVNVYYDEIKYNAILNSDGDWQFPISNHNPNRLEIHSYQAEAINRASPNGNKASTEKRKIASIKVYDIDTNTAPFINFEENSYNAVKISDKTYSFTANLIDVDGDDIFYRYHWGDGTNSGWIGPVKTNNLIDSTTSNELTPITAEHEYENKGSYLVELEVKDSNGNHGFYNLTYDVTVSRSVNRFPIYNFENLIMFLESIIEKLFSFF